MSSLTIAPADLRSRWAALREQKPGIRIRNAAHELDVSELELLETALGEGVTRLKLDFASFLPRLSSLGEVMALTRNASCVIETEGRYDNAQIFDHASQVIAPGVDLRIFASHWVHAYAVDKEGKKPSRSLQVFDRDGQATHKIFMREESNLDAYRTLVDELRHEDQQTPTVVVPHPASPAERPDAEVDAEGLLSAWAALKDTHDFFHLLRRFKVSRTQALRLAEGRFTQAVEPNAGRRAIEMSAKDAIPLMAFVGSRGCIQIFTGKVKRTFEHGGWFNVMDPGFNLHLDQSQVASAWVVQKPGENGVATSVELYDTAGENIALLFGLRKPGGDGGAAWKAMTETLS